uniref:Fork-head domain-containing protein n=1 Tax=Malurus cyaneus samueli TaxID=2593467 RepID=A0A8C5UF87_9PASS
MWPPRVRSAAAAAAIDPDFEPQSRPRSCTWPLPHPDLAEEEDGRGAGAAVPGLGSWPPLPRRPPAGWGQLRKAKTSRRNAWGNLSYADLITKAIESSPEKRLTLSQIYDWMVRYVPYFKDKGDSNSSAGWKVPDPLTPSPAQLSVPPSPREVRARDGDATGSRAAVTGVQALGHSECRPQVPGCSE